MLQQSAAAMDRRSKGDVMVFQKNDAAAVQNTLKRLIR
jgi:hypothetical protein